MPETKEKNILTRAVKAFFRYFFVSTIFCVLFTYITIFQLEETITKADILQTYIYTLLNYLGSYWYVLGFYLFAICLFTYLKSRRSLKSILRRVFFTAHLHLSVAIVAIVASFYITLAFFYYETQQIAEKINTFETSTELQTDTEEVASTLRTSIDKFKIVTEGERINAGIINSEISKSNRGNYYKQLGASIPDIFYPQIEFEEGAFLYDNVIAISRFDDKQMITLAPSLGYYLVGSFLSDRRIPQNAEVVLLTPDEYQKQRETELNEILTEYDEYLEGIRTTLDEAREQLANDQYYLDLYGGEMWERWVKEDKQIIANYQSLLTTYEQYRQNLENKKVSINYELGLFSPPNTIKLVYVGSENYPPVKYLKTLIHEYLHYSTYNPIGDLNRFFDEGITEYLSQKISDKYLDAPTAKSYLLVYPVVKKIFEDIPEEKILSAYFSKSNFELIRLLNDQYGEGFYEKHEVSFNYIVNTSDEKAEELAEQILSEMEE